MIANQSGSVVHEIVKPDSPVIPESFEFKAKKVLTDSDGFIFVLCEGGYYGAMVFDTQYNFCGFFGANRTSANLLDTLKSFVTKLFLTDAKKQYSLRKLPYEFDDFYEYGGFIYTATKSSPKGKGQIRKLSSTGVNTLYHNGKSGDDFTFGHGETVVLIDKTTAVEAFGSVAVDNEGYIYALDNTYGHIFVYDHECNLVTAFGGGLKLGNQLGAFASSAEIGINRSDVIVTDDVANCLTVFKRTKVGQTLYKAINTEAQGEYEDAFPLWREVLQHDAFNQRAYNGMANYYLTVGDYEKALEYSKKALNKDVYGQAFEEIRRKALEENFVWLFVIVLVIVALLILLAIRKRKKVKSVLDLPPDRGVMMRILTSNIHPIETAYYIKRLCAQKQNKKLRIYIAASFVIMFLMFIFKVLETTMGGFLFVNFDVNKYNSALVFISTFGVAILWCIINWALCTLFQGKGTFREILITTSFALIPQIIYSIFFIIASHCLVYSESAIISGMSTIAAAATVIILLVELSVIHEYSFFRAIGMSIATIIGMCVSAFMILLTLTLFQDVIEFFRSVYNEVFYRN